MLLNCVELECFNVWERFTLMVAAIAHDAGHLGVSNQFLMATRDPLAIQYNFDSVQENMHCSILFQIALMDPVAPVFADIPEPMLEQMRKLARHAILNTDIGVHFKLVASMEELAQEVGHRSLGQSSSGDEVEADKLLVAAALLHLADLGNVLKRPENAMRWARLIVEENFRQVRDARRWAVVKLRERVPGTVSLDGCVRLSLGGALIEPRRTLPTAAAVPFRRWRPCNHGAGVAVVVSLRPRRRVRTLFWVGEAVERGHGTQFSPIYRRGTENVSWGCQ